MKTFLICYMIFINVFSILLMAFDKFKAKNNMWRIKERTLFLVALLGGSPGMYLGMLLFRHKTRHQKFYIGIPAVFIIETVLLVVIFLKCNF